MLGIGFFLSKMDISFQVGVVRSELFVRGDLLFGALALAQNSLSGFLVIPEIGISAAGFEGLQAFAVAWRVKDNSARA